MSYLWQIDDRRIQNDLRTAVVEAPQAYDCSVCAYIRGHGQMLLEAYKPTKDADSSFYIGFEGAWYFEGPLRWQGIDFRIGSIDEVKDLLREGWLNTGDLLEEFANRHILVILERPTYRVRILAANIYLGEVAPFTVHLSFGGDAQQERKNS